VDVGIQAEVAGLIDDEVGALPAQTLCKGCTMGVHRAHFRVQQARPEQNVAMLKCIDPAQTFRPAVGIDGTRTFGFIITPAHGCRVIPVHGTDVITVGAILDLQLPVAVIDIRRTATKHFEPLGCLVHHLIDDDAGFSQVITEFRHRVAEATEEKASIVFETVQALEVV
nr:hypothetical protein [Tanacetum cinerariifolium]